MILRKIALVLPVVILIYLTMVFEIASSLRSSQ